MAMGRAKGDGRVQNAIRNALDSPLLYGSDISNAQRILFNIYTSSKHPIFVKEMREIDAFFDDLNPNIKVIWGLSDDDSLDEDAKVTILATGLNNELTAELPDNSQKNKEEEDYDEIISKLYHPIRDSIKKPSNRDDKKEPDESSQGVTPGKKENDNIDIPTEGTDGTNDSTDVVPPIVQTPIIEENPTAIEKPKKPLTLGERVKNRIKAIAEGLDILIDDDAN